MCPKKNVASRRFLAADDLLDCRQVSELATSIITNDMERSVEFIKHLS